jgi:predicted dehydrogenase
MTTDFSALRIGILGCANIAKQFVRDIAPSRQIEAAAVASRSLDNAAAFASAHRIPRHFGSYEQLLADRDIDAVYIPLPNSLHAEWAIKAAAAGKHVLCEKPLAFTGAEAKAMFDAARKHGVVLLESFPYYFQPQTKALLRLIGDDVIGEVRLVQASFGFNLAHAQNNIRLAPDLGGGSLLDAGSYPLSMIRLAMGSAPKRVQAHASWSPDGVDISMSATLFYEDGRRAQLCCAMDTAAHRLATIVGSKGVIETEYLNHTAAEVGSHPFGYLPSRMRVRRGTMSTIAFEETTSDTGSGFLFAAEAFAQLVRKRDAAVLDQARAASLDNAATLEALLQSARLERAVELAA